MPWPEDGQALWAELAAARGRIALTQDPGIAEAMGELVGAEPCRAGSVLAAFPDPPDAAAVATALRGSRVLLDLEVLFDPELQLDPLRLLHDLSAAAGGSLACWPGEIRDRAAAYSRPGRRDRYRGTLNNAVVLRPAAVFFPDETPFTVERIRG